MTPTQHTRPHLWRARAAASAVFGIGIALALTSCAPASFAQRDWEQRVGAASGVVGASWSYYNGWPSSGSKYTAELEVSPELTEEEANEIARLSCEGEPRFDDVFVRTAPGDSHWSATKYGLVGSCFDPEELVRFARVLDALRSSGPELTGEVVVHSFDPDGYQEEPDDGSLDLVAETTTAESLFTLLREIRLRAEDIPLEFRGWVDEDGSTITNFGPPLDLHVPAGFPLDTALPLLERAYDLPHRAIRFSPDGISVSPANVGMISDPATLALQADSQQAGVPFSVLPPQGPSSDERKREAYGPLILAIAALPGIAEVQLPAPAGGAETKVRATEWSALGSALELIAASAPVGAEIYLEGPQDTMFVRVLNGGEQHPGMVEAYAQMMQAQATIPQAEFVALVVYDDRITMRFDLADTATAADLSVARAALLQLIEASPIDEISLNAPSELPSEQLGARSPS